MKYFDIEFIPKDSFGKPIDTLKKYTLIFSQIFCVDAEEHDSSHYPESTYFQFLVGGVKVKLYLSDEEGKDEWLCLEAKSSSKDVTFIFNKIKPELGNFSTDSDVCCQ